MICRMAHYINPLVPGFNLKLSRFIACHCIGDARHEWVKSEDDDDEDDDDYYYYYEPPQNDNKLFYVFRMMTEEYRVPSLIIISITRAIYSG